jgi:hypothetical protein
MSNLIDKELNTSLNDKIFVPPRDFINVYLNIMSNQYGDFTISKKVFDGPCAGQKNQMLHIWNYIHKRIEILNIN